MASRSPPSAEFTPLRTASSQARIAALILGSLLWLLAAVVVGIVVDRRDAVEVGLLVTLSAFVVSLGVSTIARRLRLREEREAERP